jgi:hypothetical protein
MSSVFFLLFDDNFPEMNLGLVIIFFGLNLSVFSYFWGGFGRWSMFFATFRGVEWRHFLGRSWFLSWF